MTSQPIIYEKPEPGIARIWLNRAEAANAQDTQFLYELSAALDRGAREDDVRERNHLETQDRYTPIGNSNQHHRPGAEGRMSREEELYTGLSERWRNLPKPTIAAVQGKCVSGGLLLCWPCDIIIASDDAEFQEVTVAMGIAGVEWFAHPWEMGARKAKEMLMTGAPIAAEEARQLGMVNKVVPRDQLEEATLEMARAIARQPTFATKMAKMAVNAAQDAQGRHAAFQVAFALHHMGHAHWMEVGGLPVYAEGIHSSVKKSYAAGDEPFRAPRPKLAGE